MSFGFGREPDIFNLNDTAELHAWLYDENGDPVKLTDLSSVSFEVEKPDKTRVSVSGTLQPDGSGTGTFDQTDKIGEYTTVATFVATSGSIKSTRADFEVIDPFQPPTYSQSYVVAVESWAKFEDCFDAEDEGPWLRDMTLNYFNKDKMESFIDSALMDINLQNPPTAETIDRFVTPAAGPNPPLPTSDLPLLTTGVMIQVIRHLMRSYTEQPNPTGAPIAWHDRRDYLQRWQSVYQIEYTQYMRLLALWKRQFLGLGMSKTLISAKAGRMISAPMRTRFVGRGYW